MTFDDTKDILIAGLTITTGWVAGMLKWNTKKLLSQIDVHENKIDALAKNSVPRPEHNATIESLRKQNEEGFKGTHERIDRLLEVIMNKGK